MRIDTRNRSELKQYFVRNAIPTERHFAELIDGMVNPKEDGIAKSSGNPLSIEASSDGQKRVIHFYDSFADAEPAWVLSMNPRQRADDPASARPGLSIGDSAGNSRLFIDRETGKIGIGTIGPLQAALHIERGATNELALMLSSSGPGWGSGLQFKNTPARGAAKTFGIYAGSGALHIADEDARADRMVITGDGSVGVGTNPTGAKLQVAGTVKANRFTSDNALVLNDYATVNPTSNVYLYSPPNDRDAWIYLDSVDASSNWGIYHRQVDSPASINGLPRNSIGFIGGGVSRLQAYIGLADGSAFFAGNLTMRKNVLSLGTTDGAPATAGEVVGAIGFLGYTQQHGQLSFRAGRGFELVDCSADGPSLGYAYDSKPYADLKLRTLVATSGALIHAIGIGTQIHGATTFPYETIQLHQSHNLRIWFRTTERFILANDGELWIKFERGYWKFQNDGNLVKYDNAHRVIWALNAVSGRAGWS